MSIRFLRPVGAVADFNELEYIMALHQSCKEVDENFEDGSIDADDVVYFLLSRFGISVTPETVRKNIFSGIAGGDDKDDCLDLAEVLSLLIIPLLLSVAKKNEQEKGFAALSQKDFIFKWQYDKYLRALELRVHMVPPETVIEDMVSIILKKTLGYDPQEPPKLTKELIRSMFAAYGEIDLVKDEVLINKMIAAAADEDGKEVVLDAKAFARALTRDIGKYNVKNDYSLTTIRDDVFGKGETEAVQEIFTAPQIDFLTERFNSQLNAILSLVAFILAYVSHIFLAGLNIKSAGDLDGCNGGSELGCSIAQSIVNWLIVLTYLCCAGVPFVSILNLGNRTSPSFVVNLVELVLGIIGVSFLLIFPAFVSFDASPFFVVIAAKDADDIFDAFLRWILFTIGLTLLIIKISSLFELLFSDTVSKYPILSALLTPASVKKEFHVKQAATYKVNQMVKHALELHSGKIDNEHVRINLRLRESEPMLNFNAISKELEPVGGISWAWKNYLKGKLSSQEGIWINARIKSGVFFQFLFAILMIVLGKICFDDLLNLFELSKKGACVADADPTSCTSIEVLDSTFYYCEKVTFGQKCWAETSFYLYFMESACELIKDTVPRLYKNCEFLGNVVNDDGGNVYALVDGSRKNENFCALSVDHCILESTVVRNANATGESEYYSLDGTEGACILGLEGRAGKGCDGISLEDIGNVGDIMSMFWAEHWLSLWQMKFSVTVATIVGFSWSFNLGLTYIASAVSTVLRYRSGVFQSLRGRSQFNKNRSSSSFVSVILGAMFWGDFYSSIIILFMVLVILLVLFMPFVRPYFIKVVASVSGIAFSIGLKKVLVMILGKRNTRGFYTSNPLITNVFGVALECWEIALTGLVMFVRTVKIIVAAVLFIGRIDIPFLADGADTLGPLVLDPYSVYFRQDLLSADAHHHPYIERLGCMYLMNLRHGEEFCNMHGSTWRLLFIFALMPWVQNNRIVDDDDTPVDEDKPKKTPVILPSNLSSGDRKEVSESVMAKNTDLLNEIEKLKSEILLMKEGKVQDTSE